ncbi:MAG: T9SS type A sorting domain-containing protein, partial [Bacteroidota bacterium]
GMFNVRLQHENNETVIANVYNQLGQEVYSNSISSDQKNFQLNLSGLSSGVYFLNIKSGYNFASRKIIIE